ncbi:CubicO group peptidase (beta-lactamase class C family) [Lachnotalea glycerini]|uniref:CubicO group peptidase (Beta-lactamase class C family) n=1 Tax=Lachnotalea glycerini TaxID=1763509 RepID=A0A318EJP1_9FIRM|nr:serine hydrolase domain-containing protein [Lachnotalea glycerini]PXV85601.1 CubicO group peptidase (beta-lactamase class C family) [Lachnotalea glycerini]
MENRIKQANQSIIDVLNLEIEKGQLPGAAISIIYKGQNVINNCLGYSDLEQKKQVTQDSIFRIYSMSKPIAAVAAMIQVERGLIDIYAPIQIYLPEFKNMQVCKDGKLEKAKREILVKDLLDMTSGIVYPDIDEAGLHMEELFTQLQTRLNQGERITTLEICNKIANIPLAFHPGERWRYGLGVDVMGAIIEVTSGMRLSEFYAKEIFNPLGMQDTGFYVEQEKQERLSVLYKYEDHLLKPDEKRHLCLTKCLSAPSFESAGAGIVSTLRDYNQFAQMLVNYGTYRDVKLLSRKSVELFTQNHLTRKQLAAVNFETSIGYGYGNFMRVYQDLTLAGALGTVGEFGWDGWSGPYVTINPFENLTIVMMLQRGGYTNASLIRKIRNIAYSIL